MRRVAFILFVLAGCGEIAGITDLTSDEKPDSGTTTPAVCARSARRSAPASRRADSAGGAAPAGGGSPSPRPATSGIAARRG